MQLLFSRSLIFSLLLVIMMLSTPATYGCGLRTDLPQAFFKRIDEQGHVLISEKVGNIDFGGGTTLPVWAEFNSSNQKISPYLGKGWTLEFVESHLEPIDENTFKAVMPDGWNYTFGRKEPSSDDFTGNRGWLAHLDRLRDTFTAWAPCGWKVEFTHGKITSMTTPDAQEVSFNYSGEIVSQVTTDTTSLISITMASTFGMQTIQIGSSVIQVRLAKEARVEMVAGKATVTGDDPALGQLTFAGGDLLTIVYGVISDTQPSLTVTEGSTASEFITWNPETKQIEKDGDWVYQLKPGDGHSDIPLTRLNSKGQMEYHFNDGPAGVVTDQTLDGVRTQTFRFINAGVISGKIRKVTQTVDGVTKVAYSATYDENGKMMSQTINGAEQRFDPTYISEQIDRLKAAVASAQTVSDKQNATFRLALYLAQRGQGAAARELTTDLTRTQNYAVLTLSYANQSDLPNDAKVAAFTELKTTFPEKAKELDSIIKAYSHT